MGDFRPIWGTLSCYDSPENDLLFKIGIRLAFIDMWYAVFGKWRFYSLAAFSIVGFTVKMRSGGFYTHGVTRGGPVSD